MGRSEAKDLANFIIYNYPTEVFDLLVDHLDEMEDEQQYAIAERLGYFEEG